MKMYPKDDGSYSMKGSDGKFAGSVPGAKKPTPSDIRIPTNGRQVHLHMNGIFENNSDREECFVSGATVPVPHDTSLAIASEARGLYEYSIRGIEEGRLQQKYPPSINGLYLGEVCEWAVHRHINDFCLSLGLPELAGRTSQRIGSDVTLDAAGVRIEVKGRPARAAIQYGNGVEAETINTLIERELTPAPEGATGEQWRRHLPTIIVFAAATHLRTTPNGDLAKHGVTRGISAVNVYGWAYATDFEDFGHIEETVSASHSQTNRVLPWKEVRRMGDEFADAFLRNVEVA